MKCLSMAIPFIIFLLPSIASAGVPGIPNFHEIDAHVYRGGQPSLDGYKYLAQIGVKTVIDLREAGGGSSAEQEAVEALGMHFVNVPMSGLTPPTSAQMVQILSLLEDGAAGAVFVHCRRGADRTGAVIAAYRIDHDHWDNPRALQEAMADGMSLFQAPRQGFIRNFRPLNAASVLADSKPVEAGPQGPAATRPIPVAPAGANPSAVSAAAVQ